VQSDTVAESPLRTARRPPETAGALKPSDRLGLPVWPGSRPTRHAPTPPPVARPLREIMPAA